jgi:NADH:ubiquinone oxidoreductase subunit E
MPNVTFYVCTNRRFSTTNPSCGARGSEELLKQLQIATQELNISVEEICCLGHCTDGMVVKISPCGTFHHHVTELDIPTLIARHSS